MFIIYIYLKFECFSWLYGWLFDFSKFLTTGEFATYSLWFCYKGPGGTLELFCLLPSCMIVSDFKATLLSHTVSNFYSVKSS